ncbi:hypothetical protein FJTKL_10001 [Diaporthe vaccinii]|uniref:Uncharacterized protein n=1 Tax=Diaporthe vaccinii TaxID=105482 RepID=A0ABR4EM38_9PEZI
MARLVEIRPIRETQWILTSAFNCLNSINWLAPQPEPWGGLSPSHVVARFTGAVSFPSRIMGTTLLSSALFSCASFLHLSC